MLEHSYLRSSFTVTNPDARLRRANNLMLFETLNGKIQTIPPGSVVDIDAVKRFQTGAKTVALFAHTVRKDRTPIGWTSTINFEGKFINETFDLLKPSPGSGKFGPHAAWSEGAYIGQVDLVEIVGANSEIERLSADTASPFLKMKNGAAAAGIELAINSGFRSYPEQKMLWVGFQKRLPGFNLAAKPGNSNHQNGIALDISVRGADGNETYEWLKQHAPAFGFVRTVNAEPWHWEYDPDRAQLAVQNGTYKIPSVTN